MTFMLISNLSDEKKGYERTISEPKNLKMATAVLSLLLLVPLVISEPTCETVVTKVTR